MNPPKTTTTTTIKQTNFQLAMLIIIGRVLHWYCRGYGFKSYFNFKFNYKGMFAVHINSFSFAFSWAVNAVKSELQYL